VNALLELRGVHAAYGELSVLHGVDVRVAPGEVVALLGPNGAGKPVTELRHSLPPGPSRRHQSPLARRPTPLVGYGHDVA
jgi:branched-chain amino acid transport system ATP-binding protein